MMQIQAEPTHYLSQAYDTKERFISYWHQINEILMLKPEMVLEIGIGNAFVAQYLRQRGLRLLTMDIDERLQPDAIGSVLDIPFADMKFDVVACCEVLEHLPYDQFPRALKEIHRVSRRFAILTLPDTNRSYRLYLHIPKIGVVKRLISIPRLVKRRHSFDGEHYWEIGKAGYPLNKIIGDIRRAGFLIEKTCRIFEYPYHRFFILAKQS